MNATKTRSCPDCFHRNGGEPCTRCVGNRVIDDLGMCEGVVFDDTQEGSPKIPCVLPADREVSWEGEALLCDGHAIAKALELGKPCPACGGNPGAGMHRGEVVGQGKVMTCGRSQNVRDLQALSNLVTSASKLGISAAQATDAIEKIANVFGSLPEIDDSEMDAIVNEVLDGVEEPLLHDYAGDGTCRACGNVRKFGDAPQAQCRGTREPTPNPLGLRPIFSQEESEELMDDLLESMEPELSYAAPLVECEHANVQATSRDPVEIEDGVCTDCGQGVKRRVGGFDDPGWDGVKGWEVTAHPEHDLPDGIVDEVDEDAEEDDEEARYGDEEARYGDECLTDSERNPSLGGPPDDRLW